MKKALIPALALLILIACAPVLPTPTPTLTATATSTPTAIPTSTATPSPIPAATGTPGPSVTAGNNFTAFAQRIAAAVEKKDAPTIVTMTVPTMVDCRGLTEETPWCNKDNLGRVISGVKVGSWRSDYSLLSQQDYQNLLGRFFSEAQAGASDRYGSGAVALLAIGHPGGEDRDIVLSAITSRGREAWLLRSRTQDGRWGIEGVIVVATPLIGEVLPPGSGDYTSEPWRGT